VTRWDFTISPGSLSDDYDLLLGTRFIRHFRLHLMFNEPCTIRLTAEDGRVTHAQEEQQEEHIEQEAQGWRRCNREQRPSRCRSRRNAPYCASGGAETSGAPNRQGAQQLSGPTW